LWYPHKLLAVFVWCIGNPVNSITSQIWFRLTLSKASACRLLLQVSCLAYYLTLKVEATCSSETSCSFLTTWSYNPQDCTLKK
jgi:hypothetical protein